MSKKSFRILFMGTPEFAVESLRKLHENFEIVAVVTAPDKPRGRGQELSPTPVKLCAQSLGLPILQPTNLKSPDFIEALRLLNPDLGVIVAFRMLPEAVWSLPRLGSINLHASLLPHYRGAAPINHAIINGETVTGVTTFFLKHEIDTGNIIDRLEVPIEATDNAGSLHDKLMYLGAELLCQSVEKIYNNNYTAISQDSLISGELKSAPKITKEFCQINWNQPGKMVHNHIRGLSPYPGAYTHADIGDKPTLIKIYQGFFTQSTKQNPAGTVCLEKGTLKVAVADGWYHIKELQQAGKKRMNVQEFLNGLQQKTIEKFYSL